MKTLIRWMPLLLAGILISCSSRANLPTEAEARAALEKNIIAFSQGCIRLVDFHVTGERKMGDVVQVDATARLEFLEDCDWPMETEVLALKVVPPAKPGVKKGEIRTARLTLQFGRTSQGWETTRIPDRAAGPAAN